MRTRYFLICTTLGIAAAQQVVAPTTEAVGSSRGENVGNYNITNSFETGYRWSLIDGNLGKYRSDVNYRNGIRLLGSSLTVNSKDGHGKFFDEIVLNTQGLGNDPYQSAILRVQKNSLYRYDLMWRLNEYYNPGLITSLGEHLQDTRRRLQDHELTLLPQWKVRFHLGYSRNSQDGPALSTIQVFSSRGDEFPLFQNVNRLQNEYRVGADADLKGIRFTFQHRWLNFREDSPIPATASVAGNNPADAVTLSQFNRTEPYSGHSPAWLGTISTNRKWIAFTGRATYVGGVRGFALDETAAGNDGFNPNRIRQVLVAGDAQRPVTTGDFSISIFPTSRLSVSNSTAVHSTRIDGNSIYREFNNASLDSSTISFRFLGIRTVSNTTSATYRAANWLSVYGRYGYSDRLIRTVEGLYFPGTVTTDADTQRYEQDNTLHTGSVGVRVRPLKPLSINLDGEVGRTNNPFTPISDKDYHTIGSRVEYRAKRFQVSGTYRQIYNINAPLPLSVYSSHSRNYSANASWFGRDWFSIDAAYVKMHLDTATGLAFFAGAPRPRLQTDYSSIYTSNIHSGSLGTHFVIRKKVDLYAGYNVTRDTGDGRPAQVPAGVTDPIVATVLAPVQTFPLAFHSPLARVSVPSQPQAAGQRGLAILSLPRGLPHPVGLPGLPRAHRLRQSALVVLKRRGSQAGVVRE